MSKCKRVYSICINVFIFAFIVLVVFPNRSNDCHVKFRLADEKSANSLSNFPSTTTKCREIESHDCMVGEERGYKVDAVVMDFSVYIVLLGAYRNRTPICLVRESQTSSLKLAGNRSTEKHGSRLRWYYSSVVAGSKVYVHGNAGVPHGLFTLCLSIGWKFFRAWQTWSRGPLDWITQAPRSLFSRSRLQSHMSW